MASLVGEWELVESEYFEEFLKEMGVNLIMRKAAKAMKPKLELRNENGQWIQLFKLPIKTIESKYRDGQEFTEEAPNGDKMPTTIHVESASRHVGVSKHKNGDIKVVTELVDPNTLVKINQFNNIVCKRVFKRIA